MGWIEIWQRSRESWHWPLLPPPVLGEKDMSGSFAFSNYQITLDQQALQLGPLYLENLFHHLIVQYIFCPRSLEYAGILALAALKGLGHPSGSNSTYFSAYGSMPGSASHIESARRMVNIFSDIVSDSFRLERSERDEELVLMGWRRLGELDGRPLNPLDRVVLGFLRKFWG
ncbi:MAG TPA: VWA domain-containing protein, partial [Methanothrix soehngenii]|nr:VWA domain-containing protein [Methanothrix soehngenii]